MVQGCARALKAAELLAQGYVLLGDHPAGSQFFPSLPASLGPGLHLSSEVSKLYEFLTRNTMI